MKKKYTIVGRGSNLSRAQLQLFEQKVLAHFPDLTFDQIIKTTQGDIRKDVSLDSVRGQDFFTREIQEAVLTQEADFAVHSMKDISHLDFFKPSTIAVIDRGLMQDVAIFKPGIIEKLKSGKEIIIGTSSPRRSSNGVRFLGKSLPKFHDDELKITTKLIRGNVDSRLEKLTETEDYDGLILAITGINRLLAYEPSKERMQFLLANKKFQLLSLFECPPAINQAALVVECSLENAYASTILKTINHSELLQETQEERRVGATFGGKGCSRQYGVFSSKAKGKSFLFAWGLDQNGLSFTHWDFEPPSDINPANVLYLKDIKAPAFNYELLATPTLPNQIKNVFVTHRRTVGATNDLNDKSVWTAGVNTWFSLAEKGVWVDGCTDGLGFDFLKRIWDTTFFSQQLDETQVFTNGNSKSYYPDSIKHVAACYKMTPTFAPEIIEAIQKAKAVFWSSYQQYDVYKKYLSANTKHFCASGRTAELLAKQGVNAYSFPTIKAFKQWRSIQ